MLKRYKNAIFQAVKEFGFDPSLIKTREFESGGENVFSLRCVGLGRNCNLTFSVLHPTPINSLLNLITMAPMIHRTYPKQVTLTLNQC